MLQESGLTLKLSVDGRQLLAIFQPPPSINEEQSQFLSEVDQSLLRGELTEQFPGLYYFEHLLPELVVKIRAQEAFEQAIGEVRDAEARVQIDADRMSAYLSILPPAGGAPVTREQVATAIKAVGLVFGIDNDVLEQAIKTGRANNLVIARGHEPEHGENGRIDCLMPSMKERKPSFDEHGAVDFRNLGEILVVHPGATLVRRVPATSGKPGVDVLGHSLSAKVGKEIAFAPGLSGVSPDSADPDVLIATITGQPVQVKNGVMVEPTYAVDQVDLSSGNIVFDGSVKVKGDVQAGMTIRASGDIHIAGTVEAATEAGPTLEAGGDIVIQGGVIGRIGTDEGVGYTSRVNCKGSFTARFVQNVQIFAEDGIYVTDTAIQSELSAGNEVVVGKRGGSGKGRIIGGQALATLLVRAQVIGSPSLTKTVVEVGFHHLMHERLRRLTNEKQEWEQKLDDVRKIVAFAKQYPGRLPEAETQKAEKNLVVTQARVTALQDEHDALSNMRQQAINGRVIAEKTLYEGAEIMSGGQHYRVVAEREGGVFRLSGGQLVLDDLPRR